MVVVKLACVIVGVSDGAVEVQIDDSESVSALKMVIQKAKEEKHLKDVDSNDLQLFLAKTESGAWLGDSDPGAIELEEGNSNPDVQTMINGERMRDVWTIKEVLKENGMPTSQLKQIHVLVKVPEVQSVVVPARKRQKTEVAQQTEAELVTPIKHETISTIASNLDLDMWQVGGFELGIHRVEPDFPEWFYARKETLDLIKLFNTNLQQTFNTVFVGSPGVGTSTLVVLLAFYMALQQQKRVVLFRKLKEDEFFMLYLDPEHQQYWRKHTKSIADLDLVGTRDFELCLDGFLGEEIDHDLINFDRLTRFRMLATSIQYDMKNDETRIRRKCLVPFWSKADITAVGEHYVWSELDIKERYYYSGGNLSDFLSEDGTTKATIDRSLARIALDDAEVLCAQYGRAWNPQVDRLRMVTVATATDPRDPSNLKKYWKSGQWVRVITSEYVLRRLSLIVRPSYYTMLWSNARVLKDNGLMRIAFENYVHTMARSGETIKLQVKPYGSTKTNQHTYVASELNPRTYRNEGRDAAECEAVMRELADVDYWYPLNRCLETMDSVAKLNMGGGQNVTAVMRITMADEVTLDSQVLDNYARLFPGDVRHVVLVPDKETSDKFLLSPADPPTQVPLYVAHLATGMS